MQEARISYVGQDTVDFDAHAALERLAVHRAGQPPQRRAAA